MKTKKYFLNIFQPEKLAFFSIMQFTKILLSTAALANDLQGEYFFPAKF